MKFEKVNPATGATAPGFSRGTGKYSGNQHMKTNSDALINKGRGPTVGNHSDDDSTYPDAARVPALPAQGSIRDNINRGAQVRTPGGTKEMPKCGRESFNFGRGPTKGNQR